MEAQLADDWVECNDFGGRSLYLRRGDVRIRQADCGCLWKRDS